jgi:hypothetical protein
MNPKSKYILIGALVAVAMLFVGYAAGRGYKTYEINLAKKESEHNSQNASMSEHTPADTSLNKELVNPKFFTPKIVSLLPVKDADGGYNLKIETKYFRFTPDLVGKQVLQNTGHAHIYVNDVKVGRAYSNWFYIQDSFFQNGTNTISVTLNANNHKVWWSKNGTEEVIAKIFVQK